NPTSGMTDIVYNVAEAGYSEIRIIDASGRLVGILDKGDKAIGNYTAHLDAANLSEGIYFVQLVSNGSVITKKVVVAH
ncbi:MAG TPA: T9SS type A sorting domain-containing protein, partial [Bacteroidia bacterium]|nr:T9SS type A sorting domain-containing protein [Bacteroidia bacterium]